jgi:hypothetical protein
MAQAPTGARAGNSTRLRSVYVTGIQVAVRPRPAQLAQISNRHVPVTHAASAGFEAARRSVGVTTKPRSGGPRMSTSGSITT